MLRSVSTRSRASLRTTSRTCTWSVAHSPLMGRIASTVTPQFAAASTLASTMLAASSIDPFHSGASSPTLHNQHHHLYRHQQIRTRVFVSRHNQSLHVTSRDITDFFSQLGLDTALTRTTTSHCILQECPFCTKPVANKQDNMYKLYVQIGGGAYFCHRCGAGGSWFDLKLKLGGFAVSSVADGGTNNIMGSEAGLRGVSSRQRGSDPKATAGGGSSFTQQSRKSVHSATASASATDQMGYKEFMQHGKKTAKKETDCLPMPSPRLQACYNTQLLDQTPNATLDYLQKERGLNVRTLRKYGVGSAKYNFRTDAGAWEAAECVTFPWLMSVTDVIYQESLRGAKFEPPETAKPVPAVAAAKGKGVDAKGKSDAVASKVDDTNALKDEATSTRGGEAEQVDERDHTFLTRRIKVRALANKAWQRLDPPGGGWGLFGFHTVPRNSKEIVLCEGEYDAMAVWQATGRPAVSLPNGCRSLPVEVLPQLEGIEKIYLWMDNDGPGQEGAELFSKKIGLERCFIVRPTNAICGDTLPKDANEALLKGMDLNRIIEASKLVPHERILTFEELRADVLHEIFHPDKYEGVPMTSLPGLTSIMKGFRRGELTVITGATGSGKTTFLGQMSLDLAEQGINVLWGSFEIKNTRLMHKLLQQFSRAPLPVGDPTKAKELEPIADRFSNLPLYFMKFHGGSDVKDVLDAMDYAVYVNDAEHIILDNMQFMISRERAGSSTFDKFDVQDMAIERFRQFATDKNVHVTLVVHPRKEQEDSKLSMASIYGSAKATQEADTVLILQNDNKRKYIEVKKNRFNGALGHCPLFFDRTSGRYSEQPQINGGGGGGGGGHAATATFGPQASANKPAASWDMYRR